MSLNNDRKKYILDQDFYFISLCNGFGYISFYIGMISLIIILILKIIGVK